VVVDGDKCSGCGVCVAACRSGAFALPGAKVEGLSAAAAVLVAAIRRLGSATGVAIACQHSKTVPRVGEPWLVLRVPSIEMVTAGWLLQLVGAGVGVRVIACEDKDCETRVVDLEQFVRDLGEVLGFSAGELSRGEALANPESMPAVLALQGDWIELWEPEATTQLLAAFGALGPGRTPWRVEGPGCSLGVVTIDSAGCSLCEVCVGVCPTGALQAERNGGGLLRLSVDSGRCIACRACVTCCPEAVATLERAVDGALLAAGRQVVATVATATCVTCGGPVLAGLSPALLRSRIGQSHSAIADGMGEVCADCRLAGR
jgi:ferredoxin